MINQFSLNSSTKDIRHFIDKLFFIRASSASFLYLYQ